MKNKRRWTLAGLCLTVLLVSAFGCATQESLDSLDKRVAALEQKQKDKAAADEDRQGKLEKCVNVDADEEYWNYIKLNGKAVAGKPGYYTAAAFQWNEAEKRKKDKVEECKLLYGPR